MLVQWITSEDLRIRDVIAIRGLYFSAAESLVSTVSTFKKVSGVIRTLTHAEGVLSLGSGVPDGVTGLVQHAAALVLGIASRVGGLVGGILAAAGDGVGGGLEGGLLARGLDGAGDGVTGALEGVTSLLGGGLLAVGLQGRGGLVGGGLAPGVRLLV